VGHHSSVAPALAAGLTAVGRASVPQVAAFLAAPLPAA
jgi:hypothetical protein